MKTLRLLLLAPFFACTALVAQYAAPVVAPTPAAPEQVTPPAAQADPAAVEAALKALHFDEIMGKALNQQRQMVQHMIMRASMPGTSKEEMEAFQQKALDTAFVGLSIEEIHAVAARNYGQTFTTDELRAIADFYNSPGGQAYATKRPEAEQKIGAILRPRVMASMQKIQQMTREFVVQQQAKAQEKAAAEKAKDQKASVAPAASTTSAAAAPTATKP
jgi:hypothetical protein